MNNIQDWKESLNKEFRVTLVKESDGTIMLNLRNIDNNLTIKLLPNDATPMLFPLFERYSQWFEKQSDSIESEFDEVKEGINLWLQDKYKITPTLKAFRKWFMLRRVTLSTIIIDGNFDKETGNLLPNSKLRFDFSNINETYTPEVLESDLVEFCHWKNQELLRLDRSLSEANQVKQEIEELKAAAIRETIDLFRENYKYEPDFNTLLDVLNQKKYDNYIRHEIDLNAKYIKTGRKEERAKEIHGYLDTLYNAKGRIEFNEGYVVSNSGVLCQSKEYCEYAFWELFHTSQLQNFNQINTQSEEKDRPEKAHAAKLFADLENEDWRKLEKLENEIAKIKDYTTKKKARIADRDITLLELEYEESDINSYVTQVIEAYPSKGMVFKHVPNLNEKYRRLLAECIAGLESLKKIAKARIEAKERKANLEQDQVQPIKVVSKPVASKPTTVIQYALYYYYLQETKQFPFFQNMQGGKVKAIEKVAAEKGISAKSFQLDYNKISNYPTNRLAPNQYDNISAVINMLKDYPEAQALAKDELKVVESKR